MRDEYETRLENQFSSARKTFLWLINEIDKHSKLSKCLSLYFNVHQASARSVQRISNRIESIKFKLLPFFPLHDICSYDKD